MSLRHTTNSVDCGCFNPLIPIIVTKKICAVYWKTSPRGSRVNKHLKHLHSTRFSVNDIDDQDRQITQTGV